VWGGGGLSPSVLLVPVVVAGRSRVRSCPCPMPHAPCPMPHAPCPMPHAPCPMPHANPNACVSYLTLQVCRACPAGRYGDQSNEMSALCTAACSAGYACPAGSTSPQQVQCLPGTYSSGAGTTAQGVCTPCAAGTYQGSPGMGQCDPCPAGSACPLGAIAPTACSAGQYAVAGDTSGVCSECTSCVTCAVTTGNCLTCQLGQFINTASPKQCVACTSGYAATTSATLCTSCGSGCAASTPGGPLCDVTSGVCSACSGTLSPSADGKSCL
jgi:hypothetical protein